ncbi:MAG: ATP-binding protein [Acidobacteria bacterium]|nr:ATP-binding protein [Acidobacteriota bacterium]
MPACPSVPESLGAIGLAEATIEQILLKRLYFDGERLGRELAQGLGIQFSLIEPILDNLKRTQHVAVKRSLGMGSVSSVFALSEHGRQVARDHLETNQYSGALPVPMEQYAQIVEAQRLESNWLTGEMLRDAYRHMVVSDDILGQIGPAVNSGRSFLIYGQPGNGKTYLAEALFNLQSAPVYIPYAVECMGQIIQVFDPVYHQPLDRQLSGPPPASEPSALLSLSSAVSEDLTHDPRWVKCKRPFITSGGELSLGMLDLSYNSTSKVYDAPFQMKANNGIYLIDDFGRQKVAPTEVLNRWIVPMERRVDYLSFLTGGKARVPFETFLIFSTNLNPDQLGDEAFLRRIQYKMFLRSPDEQEFANIFAGFAASKKLNHEPELIERYIAKHYRNGKKRRRCQPRDVISHALDIIAFERREYKLTDDVLDHAFESTFLTVNHLED